ncbi:MAG TPA: DUF4374 domain-containing protein [Fibrobacteria bacterium]|nr:DUF4374 domain-containing protein [Fibrobacteria bacterium]
MNIITRIGVALSVTGLLSACLLDDKKEETELTQPGPYMIGITSQGEEGTDYIMTAASLESGTLSPTRRGIEQTGWRYMAATHGMLISMGYYADNNFIVYHKDPADSTKVIEKGRFTFPVTMDQFGEVSATEALGIEIPRKGFVKRTLFRFDLDNVSITDTAIHEIWENRADSLGAQPVSVLYRDDKVYVAFYPIHARGDFSTPQTDTSYVALFSYPGLAFEKVIKKAGGGALGIYGNNNGLIKTASGDIYGYSCASRACFTTDATVQNSKVVRIKDGETVFDDAYEWDFQAATGKKLTWFAPIGGELAIARAMTATPTEAAGAIDTTIDWVALGSSFSQDLFILDLANKTATPVSGVPTHGGEYGTGVFVEDGKAYVNVVTANESYIYVVDIASASAVKGAKVAAAGVKIIAR